MAPNPQLQRAAINSISQKQRKKTATFAQPNRQEGQKYRFPMPDKAHARNALARLPQAKNMPPGMAAKVRARAHRMLGH